MKATKKPITIDFFPLDEFYMHNILEWSTKERPIKIVEYTKGTPILEITTLEGVMSARFDEDIIIKGVDGEVYPCKKDIFYKTYEV